MKQLARKASLAVMLLLLASVGTASPEGAWVLRRQTRFPLHPEKASWEVAEAYDRRQLCDAAIMKTLCAG